MAIAATPSNLTVQQASGQVSASWDAVSGATSYSLRRSTDNSTWSVIATPAVTSYLDTSVTIGTQYYYQVASVNGSGTSPYASSQTTVPAPAGEMSLMELRQRSQQRADRVNSNFIDKAEWNSYINQSLFELYDLLVTCFEDYFLAPSASFNTTSGTAFYPLPDGSTSFINSAGASFVPQAFYKLKGVDLAVNPTSNAYVSVKKFNFIDRNKYIYPSTASTIYGVYNMQYRVMGSNIEFIPAPTSGQPIRLWYVPRMTALIQDNSVTSFGVSGWLEYVIVDAAIKALQKEESDTTALMAQKMMLKQRIEETAMNRDEGQPDTISETRTSQGWGGWGYGGGPIGGY